MYANYDVWYLFTGKQKCMMKTGDCVIRHPGQYTTGLGMVVCTVKPVLSGHSKINWCPANVSIRQQVSSILSLAVISLLIYQ